MLTRTAPRSIDPYIDSLLWFDIWDDFTITFSFPDSKQDYVDYGIGDPTVAGFTSFTEMQKQATRYILSMISSFTNLVFVEMTGAEDRDATMRFGNTSITDTGFAFLPSSDTTGGDTWMSSSLDLASPVIGNYAFFALMHEIGHALGLDHPHEAEATGNPMPADRDWMAFTVMSYRSYEGADIDGYTNDDNEFAQTYMMEDIAALQAAYGASFDHNSGDTFYFVDVNTGELYVDNVTEPRPADNTIFRTLWDGGGIDMIDFANFTTSHTNGMLIDLRPGGVIDLSFSRRAFLGDAEWAPGSIFIPQLVDGNTASLIENTRGSGGNDLIHGNQVANRIDGYHGNDTIYGYGGNDHLMGWDGSDVIHGGDGDDIIESWTGNNRLYGDAGNDMITGGHGRDNLFGGEGHDTLRGEGGEDFIKGDDGDDSIFGGEGRDRLFGEAGDDYLEGGGELDELDGGTGADTMIGGDGNDNYTVDHVGDIVIELENEGSDRVISFIDYILPDYVESLTLSGSTAINATGNALNNGLVGNAEDNTLDGREGTDRMTGYDGDDTYFVDNEGDIVEERPNNGIDTIFSSVSYILTREYVRTCNTCASSRPVTVRPTDIEFLYLTGSADIDATGNEIANNIIGNAGANVLTGMEGDDTLDGGDGIDTAVFSGEFADYSIEFVSPTTLRIVGIDGTDTVSNIEFAQFDDQRIALSYADPLTTTSGDDLVTLNSIAIGGSITQIDAMDGYDTLDAKGVFAGSGFMWWRSWENDDDYVGANTVTVANYELSSFEVIYGSDLGDNNFFLPSFAAPLAIHGGQYDDTFYTNADTVDTVYGYDGNDLFEQRGGDIAYGGHGDDTFRLTWDGGLADGGEGTDLLVSGFGATIDLAAGTGRGPFGSDMTLVSIENVEVWANDGYVTTVLGDSGANVFTITELFDQGGSVVFDGRGGSDTMFGTMAADQVSGGGGHDFIDGGLGDDDLRGGRGNDKFVIDSLGDSVTELADEGTDRVLASFKFFVAQSAYANIEEYGLTGDGNTLFGTTAADALFANPDLASRVFADAGADTITGGIGNDKLYGGDDNDIIIGGEGRDRLDGGRGADDLRGGLGDDNYFIDVLGDTVTEFAGEGIDTVKSLMNWTLGDHLENLRLRGTADTGTGNELDNVLQAVAAGSTLRGNGGDDNLRGSNGDDALFGNTGNDTINGRGGNDAINAGRGDDFVKGRAGKDTIYGGSGNDYLIGGKDDDWISGGADQDELNGEGGADTFAFADGDFAGLTAGSADTITDFDQAEGDLIDLSAVDAITGTAEDDAFTFIADAEFSGTAGELRFEQADGNTMVYMDVDGDGAADYAIQLNGLVNLTEADFVL